MQIKDYSLPTYNIGEEVYVVLLNDDTVSIYKTPITRIKLIQNMDEIIYEVVVKDAEQQTYIVNISDKKSIHRTMESAIKVAYDYLNGAEDGEEDVPEKN